MVDKSLRTLWTLTVVDLLCAAILVLLMFSLLVALSVLAPEVSTAPIVVALTCGFASSVAALWYSRKLNRSFSRLASRVMNSGALALYIFGIALFLKVWVRSTSEIYMIPEGYQGDVYVIHDVPDAQTARVAKNKFVYQIPADGILRTSSSAPQSWSQSEYYFQGRDRSLKRIQNMWLTTVPETPDNIRNTIDLGIFFPRSGSSTDANGCTVRYTEFYVGTMAYLLTKYKERDFYSYLQESPINCSSHSTP